VRESDGTVDDRLDEYELTDPAMTPTQEKLKLTNVHLNHWYENQKAPNPWIGWTDQTGSKIWLHLEFEGEKPP
jgi:hypothetical protein